MLNQGQEFLCYCVVGIAICFIFDIFRSTRFVFKTSDLITHIEDAIFLLISSVLIIFSILYISSGVLRFYIVLGFLLGIVIYALTISKLCVIMFTGVLKALKNLINIVMEIHK